MTEPTIGQDSWMRRGKSGRRVPWVGRFGWSALGLILLASVLSGTLALELPQSWAEPSADAVPSSALASPTLDQRLRGDTSWRHVHIDIGAILARPLFAPSRRASAPPAAPVEKVVAIELPRLTGIIFVPSGEHAIFTHDEGKPVVVTVGGRIGDYAVKSITSDSVLVTGPGGERVLRLTFDPNSRVTPHVLHAMNVGKK